MEESISIPSELTDDGKGSEDVYSFDSLEEQFFDKVNKIQGQRKYCQPTSKTFEINIQSTL